MQVLIEAEGGWQERKRKAEEDRESGFEERPADGGRGALDEISAMMGAR